MGNGRRLVSREVDNPYFAAGHAETRSNPKSIIVLVNIRESAVETLYARGVLDRAQKIAADRFRSLWETLGGAGAAAIDYRRQPVDGGRSSASLSDRQIRAAKELKRCRALLGVRLHDLVCKVCGQGWALSDLYASKRQKLTAADNLRAALDDLCIMWNIAAGRSNGNSTHRP